MKMTAVYALLTVSITTQATPSPQFKTINDFQEWVTASVLCQQHDFSKTVTSENFKTQLQRLGLTATVTYDPDQARSFGYDRLGPKDYFNGRIELNQEKIKTNGFLLKDITFEWLSVGGNRISAFVDADFADVLALLKQKKLDQYPVTSPFSENTHYFATSKPTKESPFGAQHRAIVIHNNSGKNHQLSISCESFSPD